jgi:hypothetical protein
MTGNRESAGAIDGERIDGVVQFRRGARNSPQRLRRVRSAAFNRACPTPAFASIIPATG